MTAEITFNAVSPVPSSGYRLRYRVANSNSGSGYTTVTSSTNAFSLSGLANTTTYEYLIDSNCGNGIFSDAATGEFTT